MNPWKVSAQFAAFVWFLQERHQPRVTSREAARFAKDNWVAFLPYADQGCGRLLIAIKGSKAAGRRTHPRIARKDVRGSGNTKLAATNKS